MRTSSCSIALVMMATCFVTTGCDDLSTSIVNRASSDAVFQWHDKDAGDWSIGFRMKNAQTTVLMRAPFKNITDLAVTDGGRRYVVGALRMERLHEVCDQGPECVISYEGSGRISVARTSAYHPARS